MYVPTYLRTYICMYVGTQRLNDAGNMQLAMRRTAMQKSECRGGGGGGAFTPEGASYSGVKRSGGGGLTPGGMSTWYPSSYLLH